MNGILDWLQRQPQGLLEWAQQWPHGEGLLGKPMVGQMMDVAQRNRGQGPLEAWNDPAYRNMAHSMALALQTNTPGIKAFHGSPHDFDKFSTSKIGTGEGAQAYGHGLYFAEKEGVARNYRNNLSKGRVRIGDEVLDYNTVSDQITGLALDWVRRAQIKGSEAPIDDAIKSAENWADVLRSPMRGSRNSDVAAKAAQDTVDRLKQMKKQGAIAEYGKMYEVNIRANPDDFLDWDKPLSQQSAKVRGAVADKTAAVRERMIADASRWGKPNEKELANYGQQADEIIARMTGRDVWDEAAKPAPPYLGLVAEHQSRIGASEKLRKAGIPGIKYLDQGSRAAGEGSRNYVVFDDKLIEIIRKYGLAGLLGMGGAGLAGGLLGTPDAQAKGLLDAPY